MEEPQYADTAPSMSRNLNRRAYKCSLCGQQGHYRERCPNPSIDYQLQREPKLVKELATGPPVETSGTVVIDVDEFQPLEGEFTDNELHALQDMQDMDFSKRAADGEEIGLQPLSPLACLPTFHATFSATDLLPYLLSASINITQLPKYLVTCPT